MRLVFMGTPEFSVAFLRHLASGNHEVVAVVTQPDRPAGRGQHLHPSPVKVAAEELRIPVLQPESLKEPGFEEELRELDADLSVVVAFSLLPKNILGATRLGAVNLHGSLLPRYRGAAPVQWAVANGEHKTGLTVFLLDEKMDHGPILVQERLVIGPNDTGQDVLHHMEPLGCQALDKALDGLEQGLIEPLHQDHPSSCPAPKLRKEDGLLNWSRPAQDLHDRIRGFFPWPGAYTFLRGKLFRVHRSHPVPGFPGIAPGHFRVDSDHRVFVGTGEGALELLVVQAEGKKPMPVAEFIRGVQNPSDLVCGVKDE
jgi:methionyl-tRNA formyltransferase